MALFMIENHGDFIRNSIVDHMNRLQSEIMHRELEPYEPLIETVIRAKERGVSRRTISDLIKLLER